MIDLKKGFLLIKGTQITRCQIFSFASGKKYLLKIGDRFYGEAMFNKPQEITKTMILDFVFHMKKMGYNVIQRRLAAKKKRRKHE